MCHPLKWINKISRENEICMTLLLLVFLLHLNVILISVLPRGNCVTFYSSRKLNSNLRARSSWQCDTPSLQKDKSWSTKYRKWFLNIFCGILFRQMDRVPKGLGDPRPSPFGILKLKVSIWMLGVKSKGLETYFTIEKGGSMWSPCGHQVVVKVSISSSL